MADLESTLNQYRAAVARAGSGAFMRVTIGDETTRAALDRLFDGFDATIDDLPLVLSDAYPAMRAAFASNFADQSGRTRWAPLAPATIRERLRLGYGRGPILQRTGSLRRHVLGTRPQIRRVGAVVELRVRPGATVPGTGAPYRALAGGTSRMPGRPMLVVRPAQSNAVTSAIQRSIRQRAAANGLGS